MKISIYILPHQDDESFLIPKIRSAKSEGKRQIFYFLTQSAISSEMAAKRNQESISFLKLLGIEKTSIFFIGSQHSIDDGTVIDHIACLHQILIDTIEKTVPSESHRELEFICPAFEGGHHDHDAAFILAKKCADYFNGTANEFFLYNSFRTPGKLYRVSSPYGDGLFEYYQYTMKDRLLLFKALTSFRSQWKAMLGLWPFLFVKSFLYPLAIRTAKPTDKFEAKHNYVPMYERWGRISQKDFNDKLMSAEGMFRK